MITIPSMPTRYRPLPELELDLNTPQLRKLAGALDRAKVDSKWRGGGLCFAVRAEVSVTTHAAFEQAVSRGMNKDVSKLDRYYRYMYLYHYLGMDHVSIEELTAIRQAWAAHIARSIYEQIGA